jgi:hypothetical protein
MSEIPVYAPVVSSIISAIALVFGVFQLRLNERARQRNNSDALWRQYELLCIEYPDFAYPNEPEFAFQGESGTLNNSQQNFTRYEYFVSFFLYACEGILIVYQSQPDWKRSVISELYWHREYLTSEYFEKYHSTCSTRILSSDRTIKI